ncbi:eukaryotic translation initiation factor 4E-binding protein 1 [Prionailurus iriomotensis]
MSGSSSCSQTPSRAIPATRRVDLGDGVQLPPGDYSTTPGGTLFSTTPGGTRIIYDRKFLMECRNSPVTKTPPRDLPTIPGVTSPTSDEPPTDTRQNHLRNSPEEKPAGGEEMVSEPDQLSVVQGAQRLWFITSTYSALGLEDLKSQRKKMAPPFFCGSQDIIGNATPSSVDSPSFDKIWHLQMEQTFYH